MPEAQALGPDTHSGGRDARLGLLLRGTRRAERV